MREELRGHLRRERRLGLIAVAFGLAVGYWMRSWPVLLASAIQIAAGVGLILRSRRVQPPALVQLAADPGAFQLEETRRVAAWIRAMRATRLAGAIALAASLGWMIAIRDDSLASLAAGESLATLALVVALEINARRYQSRLARFLDPLAGDAAAERELAE